MTAPPVEGVLEGLEMPALDSLLESDPPLKKKEAERKRRWAVVGMGHFAQSSVLPAFSHLKKTDKLVALVSDDAEKAQQLAGAYDVPQVIKYQDYASLLRSGAVDVAYIALPNHLHASYVATTAEAGVHVICEKPMAVTRDECERMIESCRKGRVRLMIAYRLHLDPANMEVIQRIRRGDIGAVRFFSSAFSFQLSEQNVRSTSTEEGGGVIYDIGVYCINAARYVFGAEPVSVFARGSRSTDPRFRATEEQVGVVLEFPGGGLATFTASLNAGDLSTYMVGGTKGVLRLDPGFSHSAPATLVQVDEHGETSSTRFDVIDQVAAEMSYFGECIDAGRDPEPSGREGLHDVVVIEAIRRSLETGSPEALELSPLPGPNPTMLRDMPAPAKPKKITGVEAPRR